MPDRNSSAAQVARISAVCPISGCSSRPATITSMSQRADSCARTRPCRCIALREQPRADHREGGLHELAGLHRVAGERNPAPGALDLDAEPAASARAARCCRPAPRSAANRACRWLRNDAPISTGSAKQVEHRVADDEVPRAEAEPLGHRRARGKAQQHADRHQQDQRRQQLLVDRPPPLGDGCLPIPCKHHSAPPGPAAP